MTAIAYVSASPDKKKRLLNFTTTLPASNWAEVVRKLSYHQDVVDFEILRSSRYQRSSYSLVALVESADETDEDCFVRIFGQTFLDKFLSVTDVKEANPEFHRTMTAKMDPEEEFLIYETIVEGNDILKSYDACLLDYENEPNKRVDTVLQSTTAIKMFGGLAKKHQLEGGSWLCMPRTRKGDPIDPETTERNLRRIFEKIAMEFCTGRLQSRNIYKVSFSKVKAVVKVTNDKTIFFDYTQKNPEKEPSREEENMFRGDREVRLLFRHLNDMKLQAQLRYKPEVFTACKLNTKNTSMRLTLYNIMSYDRRNAIAMEQ